MLHLDTLKFKTPLEAIESINYNHEKLYNLPIIGSNNELVSNKFTNLKSLNHGIKKITIENKENAIIEISAKCLGSNYMSNININTIEQAIESINSVGLIKLKPNETIEQSEILLCHVTNNINHDMGNELYKSLASMPLPSAKYKTEFFNRENNIGYCLRGTKKTEKVKQIFYNKLVELTKNARNKEFIKTLPTSLFTELENIVRVESELTSLQAIRNHTKCINTNMQLVLNSKEKINYNKFQEATKSINSEVMELLNSNMKWHDFIKHHGYYSIFEKCMYDWTLIEQVIRRNNANNYRHILPTAKRIFTEKLSSKNIKTTSNIEKLKELLKYAS